MHSLFFLNRIIESLQSSHSLQVRRLASRLALWITSSSSVVGDSILGNFIGK